MGKRRDALGLGWRIQMLPSRDKKASFRQESTLILIYQVRLKPGCGHRRSYGPSPKGVSFGMVEWPSIRRKRGA